MLVRVAINGNSVEEKNDINMFIWNEIKNLYTLRYLSSKGRLGAKIRKSSETQTVTKRLTSLSRFLRRPCFIMDFFKGLNSASSSFRAFSLLVVAKGWSICDRVLATSYKIQRNRCKQTLTY